MEDFLSKLEEKGKIIVVSLVGIVVLLVGFLLWGGMQKDETPIQDVYEELLAEESTDQNEVEVSGVVEDLVPEEIIVDVKGAVHKPGVYTMNDNTRVVDAISMAGGLLGDADGNAVNLAQHLEDQMVIYVPREGEEGAEVQIGVSQPENNEQTQSGATIVNINQAEKEALMTLNGIGDSKAENILSYREENGPFQTIEDIKNVSGIGEATFNNLKEVISVD